MTEHPIIQETKRWITQMVIGLNFCPFAKRVVDGNLVHYALSEARDAGSLLAQLARELQDLARLPITERETTILIHPRVLDDFLAYNDFLNVADQLLRDLELEGVIQIASFHPEYQFANNAPEGVENYTNRSPYPMLHLLREESVTAVASDPQALLEIPKRNEKLLREMGLSAVLERLKQG